MSVIPLVVCVGDALVDLLAMVATLPERGGAVWSPPLRRLPGGTGANVVAGLAALGIPSAFVGCVGEDANGHFLVQDLEQRTIDLRGLRRHPEAATGTAVALVEPSGERTFIACALGAAQAQLTDDDLQVIDALAPTALFLTGLLLLEDPSRAAVRRLAARLSGRVRLYFDPNLRQPGADSVYVIAEAMRAVAAASDVILASESEMQVLELTPRDGQLCVVKRGENGARLEGAGGTLADVPAHPVAAVDATGAGDVFDAAFIAAHVRGYSDGEALRFANAAAALSVTQPGARAMPTWDEALHLYVSAGGERR
jgi:sugar/nucleoside kinase (ribokinase family)